MKRYLSRMFSFIIAISIFLSYSMTVYAVPKRLRDGTWIDVPWSEYGEEISYLIQYALSTIGVVVNGDFEQWLKNNETYQDLYDENGRLAKHTSIDTETETVKYDKEIMTVLKSAVDDYAKENEPYYIGKTYAFDTADFSSLSGYRNVYNTIKNLLNESKSGFIVCSYNRDGGIWFADIDRNFADLSFVRVRGNDRLIGIYDNETWKRLDWTVYYVKLSPDDEEIKTAADFKEKATQTYSGVRRDYALTQEARVLLSLDTTFLSYDACTIYSWPYLVSKETRRVRVFSEFADFQDYTLNKRKVYYTSNYYNYVPEDLSVSIDDLEKEIDDLSKVIDQLLDQITKDTDESEIEELLKQILEELRNNPGGGGGGSGGGDVNVDIDLSTTNGLLSKILAKVTQIFDKISETATGAVDTVNAKLQETLDEILSTLRTISGDVSDIKGQLADISEQEFNERSDSFLDEIMDALSEISEVVKTKFPFSIPNDLRIFLSKIAPAVPETEEQRLESYSLDTSGISLYSGEHGGGGTSDGETNPPGGGGASRPGSGFIDVEHGGSGGSRDPVEMREAPVFRLPIVIERYGIEEYIIIDMAPFDPLSRFSRGFFTIIFMVCLFNLTFKVIGMWGDLIG